MERVTSSRSVGAAGHVETFGGGVLGAVSPRARSCRACEDVDVAFAFVIVDVVAAVIFPLALVAAAAVVVVPELCKAFHLQDTTQEVMNVLRADSPVEWQCSDPGRQKVSLVSVNLVLGTASATNGMHSRCDWPVESA